jgi:hypothetical protein
VEGLRAFGNEGSSGRLASEQETALSDWVRTQLPRSTPLVGAWLKRTYGLSYSRPGLIAWLGSDYRKPEAMPRGLDDAKQRAFIDDYENLLPTMDGDEAVVFADAVHPTHQVRPVGLLGSKGVAIVVEQTIARDRLNPTAPSIWRPAGPEPSTSSGRLAEFDQAPGAARERIPGYAASMSFKTTPLVNAPSSSVVSQFEIETLPHRQGVVGRVRAQDACCASSPAYCRHLDPIEQLWRLTHQNITHNRDFKTFHDFRRAVIDFLRCEAPDTGAASATETPTPFASSDARIFGLEPSQSRLE